MANNKFFVTTPIYYVNDQPHIGHAYTSLAADVLSLYHRQRGDEVFFLTGTDEHGQKVEQAASLRGLSPKAHSDIMVENFRALWQKLSLSNDYFIRTTDAHHVSTVQRLLQELWDKGEIEKRTYAGWYCTPCERFWTEKDVPQGTCPDCARQVEKIEEDNYFFLMSRYQQRLIDHINANPMFILPETRRNEVLGFLRSKDLQDLCISRPKSRLSWGIELPFDREFVTYVWFDALINYYSAPLEASGSDKWWPADVHLIGKDILTTHAVYWSCMLMAMGLELPGTIFAHGWWTIEGRKMSKSLGNVVNPVEMAEKYGNDAFRYFLFREVPFGLDGDFSEAALVSRINTDLANDFGNLASRTLKMTDRFFGSRVPEPAEAEGEFTAIAARLPEAVENSLRRLQFNRAIDEIWALVTAANKYIDTNAPWALAKDPANEPRLRTVMYTALEALRLLGVHLYPFMPAASDRLLEALGGQRSAEWGGLKPGIELKTLDNLFPRIEVEKKKEEAKPKKEKKVQEEKKEAPPQEGDGLIKIDDFVKVVLKTGLVKQAERVEGSEKLIKMQVDTGEERQIVAGIGKAYAPEDLVGKVIVVVANLKPAKLMGIKSEGMLLAATGEDGVPVVLSPERPTAPGLRIK